MKLSEEAALDTARGLLSSPHIARELPDAVVMIGGQHIARELEDTLVNDGQTEPVARIAAILFELQSRGAIERATTSDPAAFEAEFEALKRA